MSIFQLLEWALYVVKGIHGAVNEPLGKVWPYAGPCGASRLWRQVQEDCSYGVGGRALDCFFSCRELF